MPSSDAGRLRRRGSGLDDALLDAAWQELQRSGYTDFSLNAVAQLAKTSRPVLSRRWPSRAQLVLAAIRRRVPSLRIDDIPEAGTLRGDLLALFRLLRERYENIGPAIMNGLASELGDLPPGTLDLVPTIIETIAVRAAGRGEIGPKVVPPHILAVPAALLRHELVVERRRPTDRWLARLVDDIAIPLIELASR
jgi:AcrR family transcriptional regulator